jgi:uncharacterized phiE125 gp8 family phage protein
MALSLVSQPAVEPVTLAETKTHLRVDDFSEDELIDNLRVAAREYVENFTSRKLITQTWDLKLAAFPCGGCLELPFAPVSSVTSITYVDTAGVSQTWSSANYTVDAPSGPFAMPGRITPVYGVVWPSTQNVINAVTVRFVVGYGATPWTVPYLLRAAIKVLVGHWFANREPVAVGTIVTDIPLSVQSMLWSFKFSC